MKRKLLLIVSMILLALSSNAQEVNDHVWNFSDNLWTGYAGYSSNTPPTETKDGLTIISGGSAYGAVSTVSEITFSDGVKATGLMSTPSVTLTGAVPTKRALSFPVSGPCKIKVWATAGSTNRVVTITDGVAVTPLYTFAIGASPYRAIGEYNYAGAAGTIYVYTNNSSNIARISVVHTSLGTDSFKADSSANIYSNGNQVFISNVKSNTTVSVYSVTGASVKALETSSDTSFDLESGVWIVKAKSAEGEKSVKLLVK